MENYIVRIYRRDEKDRTKVTGVIESVEQQTRYTFHTLGSLHSVLMDGQDRSATNAVSEDKGMVETKPALSPLLN